MGGALARAKEHAEERRKQFTDEGRMPPRWIGSDVRRLQELFDEPRRFWKELGSQIRVKAKLSLDRTIWLTREEKEAEERKTLAETGNYPPWRVHLYAEAPPIRIKPRRPEELALLTKPWPGTPPGKEGPPSMWPWRDQRAGSFHAWLSQGCNSVQELLALERALATGTLRDTVRLCRLMRTIYFSKPDDPRRGPAEKELLQWLDTLPEVQRQCFARYIANSFQQIKEDDPIWFDLTYEIPKRLPVRFERYVKRDFREFFFRECSERCPSFVQYLKKKGESYSWLDNPAKDAETWRSDWTGLYDALRATATKPPNAPAPVSPPSKGS